jgi:predicted nucleotide-binding protein (sugar kinase/HSP70/actin superfamily)
VYLVKDHHRRDLEVDPEMWTEEQMASALQRKEAEQNLTSTSLILVSVKRILNDGPTHGI